MALAPKKISALPNAQVGSEADIGVVVQAGETRKQTRTQLRAAIVSGWQTFIGTFLASANAGAARTAIGAAESGANDDITSLTGLTTPLAVNQGGTGGATQAAARATLGVLNVGPAYIDGLEAVWNSANSISIRAGAAYLPGPASVQLSAATITKASLVLAAATWYHVYLFAVAGTPDVEIVTTAPSTPYAGMARTKTGDTSRRYLFSFVTGAANTIIRFKHYGKKVSYLADHTAAPLAIATNVLATTSTAVSASGAVPVTATHVSLLLTSATSNPGVTLYIADGDMGAVSGTNSTITLGPGMFYAIDLSISLTQAFNYLFSASPGANGMYARVYGYLFER